MQVNQDIKYNQINSQVSLLLEDLSLVGNSSNPRGLMTKEANLATLELDPIYSIMDFTPREFNYRYFAGELAWYIKATTDLSLINNFSSFWKGICPDGHANSNYGSLLFKSHPSTRYSKDADGYPKPQVNQLEWVYNSLVKDKSTRQAVAFFNSPYFQYEGNKDFVCTMYVNFWIRKDHLDMKVQMRSNDIFFGLTYDAPWFSTLQQSMYLNLKEVYPELKLGNYYHCADNIHFYERHFKLVDEILDSLQKQPTSLTLKYPLFKFENGSLVMSDEALKYLSDVEDIIKSGTISSEQSFWKEKLQDLYNIQ